uniref:Death domain-containing protein n=1 Tax=Amphimedon queenslandica TaxID=400682 RepID=A0A1X7TE79_AMPQE
MIDDQPDIFLLLQWLEPLVDWQSFGLLLPGITQQDITIIEDFETDAEQSSNDPTTSTVPVVSTVSSSVSVTNKPVTSTTSGNPKDILRTHSDKLVHAIATDIERVTDALHAKRLISLDTKSEIYSLAGKNEAQKSGKLVHTVQVMLESSLNPEQYLIDICHVLINQQHHTLTDIATSILHQLGPNDVITTLTIRRENAVSATQREKIMFDKQEDEEKVLHSLLELNEAFASLMVKVRTAFDEKEASDPKLLIDLTRWIEAYMHWNDKLTNASLDETFKIIYPFYDFIDCSLIVDMRDVELNPGPMIDDQPDISLLIQWLEPLVDWKPFGLGLPGITHSDISKIEAEKVTIDERKLALYSKWLNIASNATWADVINALNKSRENSIFVRDIKENLQKSAPLSASSYAAVTTRLSSQAEVTFETAEDEKEILDTLIGLNKEFSRLMMHVRLGLDEKTEKDPKILRKLTIWLETYMHWNDKLTKASLDETFKIIHPFYDFIDCSLIVDMSEVFLKDFKFSNDDKLNIVSELQQYKEKADKLRISAQVKHLNESLQTIYKEHIPDTSNMPMILMKLHNPWHVSNVHGLSLLIHNLLPVGHQQSIMKYITISFGSVIIKYSVHGSTADSLIEYTGGKEQFMRLIGIFSLYINDHLVLQEDENMNFTFELALLEAVTAGNNEAVEFLLQLETVNIDHTNEEGKTALMLACKRGHEDIVHSLLSAGANVNIQDNKGWTGLMIASEHNHISIIHMLLQANANPHLKKSNGSNAVMIASYDGNYEVVELLISKGVDYKYQREDGWNSFMLACQNGHIQIVELLLKKQVDPKVKMKDGWNAFMLACQNGHTPIVELLLNEQVDPNVQNERGHTALMLANSKGHYEVVQLLLEWNADPTIVSTKDPTALEEDVASTHSSGSLQRAVPHLYHIAPDTRSLSVSPETYKMIDVSQWRASIGLWNYCQAASSRPANGRHSHSFKAAVDTKSGSITSGEKTFKLPVALFLIALLLLLFLSPSLLRYILMIPPTGNCYQVQCTTGVIVTDTNYLQSVVLPGGSSSNLIYNDLYLIVCLRKLLLLSGDVELNPGPMIDERPDIFLLLQWLEPLVDWKPFGLGLPGITHSDILKIEAENKKIDEQKSALYSKWLKMAPTATWADVINALSNNKENTLVQDIRRNLQKIAPRSARSHCDITTRRSSQAEVMFKTAEDEKEILDTLFALNKEFSLLMMHARLGLGKKTEKDPKILHKLTIWLETYMHWNEFEKLANISSDEAFKIIHPFYDFIDCSLIVEMSEIFLQDLKFGDDELSIVSELKKHKEKADKLRFSANVEHLHKSLKTIYEQHIPDTSNMPMILMKLHNPWHGSNINGLSLLIHNLLPIGHQQSIMKYITITTGCILIKYSVYGSTADSIIENTGGKEQFMRLIGILSLYINDHPVPLQEDKNMNFTFELALLEAVTAGNNEAVEFLLQLETVNIDHTNEEGKTALMLACERGHEDIVHSLLSAGANVNIQDNKGWTALMRASEHNHISIIHMLLQANANPHLKNSKGSNPVMIASYYGKYEVVELLISKGVDYKYQREDGMNAFMLACENGHTQIVELLLKEQVDPNVQEKDGWNAFMLACQNGHTQIVELLLKEQVDPNVQEKNGVNAFMLACKNGHTQIVKLLLKEQVDLNVQRNSGGNAFKPFMSACQNGHIQIVKLLLKERVDLNVQNRKGHTALMVASSKGHYEVVKLLLEWEADPTINSNEGHTAISLSKDSEISKLIYNYMYKKGNVKLEEDAASVTE